MSNQEKPWWKDEKYYESILGSYAHVMKVSEIVAEAERRGMVAAWEEVKSEAGAMQNKVVRSITRINNGKCEHKEHLTRAYKSACEDMLDYASDRIYELNKPVTDEGK